MKGGDKMLLSSGNKGMIPVLLFTFIGVSFAGEELEWQLVKDDYMKTREWSVPAFVDIDADGDYDLFLGNLHLKNDKQPILFYRNKGTIDIPSFELEEADFFEPPYTHAVKRQYMSYAFGDIDNDGDMDLYIATCRGDGGFYRNVGTSKKPGFKEEPQPELNFLFKERLAGCLLSSLVDIDADGDLDMFVATKGAFIYFIRNEGTAKKPVWKVVTDDYTADILGEKNRLGESVTFADIDDDGDYDMFVGSPEGTIFHFLNIGSPEKPKWKLVARNYNLIRTSYPFPAFVDIDGDGDKEMFLGNDYGEVSYWERVP